MRTFIETSSKTVDAVKTEINKAFMEASGEYRKKTVPEKRFGYPFEIALLALKEGKTIKRQGCTWKLQKQGDHIVTVNGQHGESEMLLNTENIMAEDWVAFGFNLEEQLLMALEDSLPEDQAKQIVKNTLRNLGDKVVSKLDKVMVTR